MPVTSRGEGRGEDARGDWLEACRAGTSVGEVLVLRSIRGRLAK